MISTRHNGSSGGFKLKPEVIEYNNCMGGVDRMDQITSYYSTPRKTIRWQMKLFFHILDVYLWNSTFTYNFNKNKLTYLQFRDAIIASWINEDPTAPTTSSGPRRSTFSRKNG